MTREEAKGQLEACKRIIQGCGHDWLDERDFPVLDLAIAALSDVTNTNAADMISRQAAIDAVLSVIPYDEYWKEQVEIAVNNMPSTESDVPDINDGDMISRQAAIDALMKRDKALRNINWYGKSYVEDECKGIDEALDIISALPSVRSEIIHCRDCKHMIINEKHENKPMICCLTKMCGTTEPNWFCADAERRTDE